MAEIRHRGVMSAVICSEAFLNLARTQAGVFGVPDMPLIVIAHPLGGLGMDDGGRRLFESRCQALPVGTCVGPARPVFRREHRAAVATPAGEIPARARSVGRAGIRRGIPRRNGAAAPQS